MKLCETNQSLQVTFGQLRSSQAYTIIITKEIDAIGQQTYPY